MEMENKEIVITSEDFDNKFHGNTRGVGNNLRIFGSPKKIENYCAVLCISGEIDSLAIFRDCRVFIGKITEKPTIHSITRSREVPVRGSGYRLYDQIEFYQDTPYCKIYCNEGPVDDSIIIIPKKYFDIKEAIEQGMKTEKIYKKCRNFIDGEEEIQDLQKKIETMRKTKDELEKNIKDAEKTIDNLVQKYKA